MVDQYPADRLGPVRAARQQHPAARSPACARPSGPRRPRAAHRQPRHPGRPAPGRRQPRGGARSPRRARAAPLRRPGGPAVPARRRPLPHLRGSPAMSPRSSRPTSPRTRSPWTARRRSAARRVDRRTQQIPDVLDDPGYDRLDLQRIGGFRSLLSTPLILEDEVVGALSMFHPEVAHFDLHDKQLLEEFALQAAIVLRQVQLCRPSSRAGPSWPRKVEPARGPARGRRDRQLQPRPRRGPRPDRHQRRPPHRHRRRLDHGVRRGRPGASTSARAYGSSDAILDQLRAVTISRDATLVGRAALDRRPLVVPDLDEVTSTRTCEILSRRRLALGAGGADAARRPDRRRPRDPAPDRRLLRRDRRAAGDPRQPVGAGHPQRPPLPRARDQERRARGGRAGTSRSSWRACPTSSAPR